MPFVAGVIRTTYNVMITADGRAKAWTLAAVRAGGSTRAHDARDPRQTSR
jgi:hypothetical protein